MRRFSALRPIFRWMISICGALLLAVVITGTVPAGRHAALRALGWSLVRNDVPQTADVIVISTDARGAGVLEASDLVHEGLSDRVALFRLPSSPVGREFSRRGIMLPNSTSNSMLLLQRLGVQQVDTIPWEVAGTGDEARYLARWCAERHINSIIFVSTSDHSRRTRRVLNRALRPGGVKVSIRYSRYSDFDPDNWWHSREGQRTQAVEFEKLAVDILLHPFS